MAPTTDMIKIKVSKWGVTSIQLLDDQFYEQACNPDIQDSDSYEFCTSADWQLAQMAFDTLTFERDDSKDKRGTFLVPNTKEALESIFRVLSDMANSEDALADHLTQTGDTDDAKHARWSRDGLSGAASMALQASAKAPSRIECPLEWVEPLA